MRNRDILDLMERKLYEVRQTLSTETKNTENEVNIC